MTPKKLAKIKTELVRKDKALAPLFMRHQVEFKPRLEWELYETLVRSIAHQQLTGKAAQTILGRMLDLFDNGVIQKRQRFPTPKEILATPDEKFRACGFSGSKVKSIKDIAKKTHDGLIPDSDTITDMSNQEIIDLLTQIYGVGRWTVEMLLIFKLGRLDVWPVDDFGIRRGYQIWKKKKMMPTAKDLKKVDRNWAPYQTIVSLHLWREADRAKTKK